MGFLVGACISYQILFTAMIGYVSEMLGANKTFVDSIGFRALVGGPATLFCFFPLSLLREMSAFAAGGLASLVALFYTAIVMVIECPFYYKQNIDKSWV